MKILFWLARHGSTTDSGKNIFRGQRNAPLDKKGFLDAHKQKDFLADKDWNYIFCSDLTRAKQTADIISQDTNQKPLVHPGLRPWDIGNLAGKDKTEYADAMQAFIDHPSKAPKGGESLNDFQNRIWPLLGDAMKIGLAEDKPCVVIGHSSVIHALSHMLYGEKHKNTAVKPGGIVEIYYHNGEFDARPVLNSGKDDSSFAVKKQVES